MPRGDQSIERPLDFLEEQFLMEYMDTDNLAEAARIVGMEYREATNLSERKAFKREVLRLKTTALGRAEVTAQRVIDEIASIGMLPLEHLGEMGIKTADKLRACELLGKTSMLKLFTEVVETTDTSKPGATKADLEERIKLMETSRDPSLIEPE